ncbi:transglycosylase domain-containing protein [Candidatus Parcubacteria bacterium]|nr:transglycosylase domain-containing protein [Candidatus Parcubacteria bacterium]
MKVKKYFKTNFNFKELGAKKILKYIFYAFLIGAISFLLLFIYFTKDLPQPEIFNEIQQSKATEIYDSTGERLLYRIGSDKTEAVKIDQIPDILKQAIISSEDANFYKHKGVDPAGFSRMVLNIGKAGGGSTITQQLIRTTFLTKEKTVSRKIREIVLSLRLEQQYSKDQILEWYLNRVPYCYNLYGVGQASKYYFGKPAQDLNLSEASLLAALIQRPCEYDPFGEKLNSLIQRRDNYVLKRMVEEHYISQEQADQAKSQTLKFSDNASTILAPHFSLYVKKMLLEEFGEDYLMENGLKVYTTLDWDLQEKAEDFVLVNAQKNIQYNCHNTAFIAINPKDGHILAMVGSKDYFGPTEPEGCKSNCLYDPKVNILTYGQGRQPGSAFKPFAYVTAFKKGYTDTTTVIDELTDFGVWGGKNYIPKNYDGLFRGEVTLRNALAQSLNIPAVKVLLYMAGLDDTIKTAQNCGINTLNPPFGPSIVLGGWEVKPIEITSAYGVFATNGYKTNPIAITKIENSEGKTIKEYKSTPKRVLDSKSCKVLNSVLSDNNARGPMFGYNSYLYVPGYEVAVKTGTSNDGRDAWTIGYTPNIVIGIWSGNNNNEPTKKVGASLSGPVFRQFMEYYLSKHPLENQNF